MAIQSALGHHHGVEFRAKCGVASGTAGRGGVLTPSFRCGGRRSICPGVHACRRLHLRPVEPDQPDRSIFSTGPCVRPGTSRRRKRSIRVPSSSAGTSTSHQSGPCFCPVIAGHVASAEKPGHQPLNREERPKRQPHRQPDIEHAHRQSLARRQTAGIKRKAGKGGQRAKKPDSDKAAPGLGQGGRPRRTRQIRPSSRFRRH